MGRFTGAETSLTEAVDARHRIGMAQGILVERSGISVDDSFALLRRYSQDGNVKIHHVADQLIRTEQLPASADRHEGRGRPRQPTA
jgi:AmiR/NasT family two-component response regulator